MKKLLRKYENLSKAFKSLTEARTNFVLVTAVDADIGDFSRELLYKSLRDSLIQRFEYTVECLWTYMKILLEELKVPFKVEGPQIIGPRVVITTAITVHLLHESEGSLIWDMIKNRNKTSHIYEEEVADELVRLLPDYYKLLERLLRRLKPRDYND